MRSAAGTGPPPKADRPGGDRGGGIGLGGWEATDHRSYSRPAGVANAQMRARIEAKLAAHDLYTHEQVDVDVLRQLEKAGVDIELVTNLVGPICHETVSFFEDGTFGYDVLGEMALLIVILDENSEFPLDILAWSARDPDLFGTLLRQASLLGADRVLNTASYYGGQPCPLWSTPLRWLQEGCQGAVVLQAMLASITIAKAVGALAAEDIEHGRALIASGAVRRDKLVVPMMRAAAE